MCVCVIIIHTHREMIWLSTKFRCEEHQMGRVYYHITNGNKLNQSKTFELTSSHSEFNPIFRAIILHTRITIKKKEPSSIT